MKLTSVPGISNKKSDNLADAGYLFVEDLAQASAWRVQNIDNCSPRLVAKAQRFVKNETKTKLNGINYRCESCDKLFHQDREELVRHHRFNKCTDRTTKVGDIFDN